MSCVRHYIGENVTKLIPDISDPWYHIHEPQSYQIFYRPKVMVRFYLQQSIIHVGIIVTQKSHLYRVDKRSCSL
jgi:hypothetical protein